MKNLLFLSMTIILFILTACTPAVPDGLMIASGSILQSDNKRVKAPEPISDDRAALAKGNAAFAFDLYRQLKTEDGNLFYSPYSVSAALAMTYAGANGNTAKQMAGTMHFTLPPETLHPAFNWLERELARRSDGKKEEAFRLHVVNAIWGQKNYKFKVTFLDTLAENYGAGLRILDFIGNPDESRVAINHWVSEQTENRIKELLAPRSITTDTRLVLTNAIYFKAAWKYKFMEEDTINVPFHLTDGSSIDVPMMRQTMLFNHAEEDGYRAIELLYQGEETSMLVLLPDEGEFAEFESSLDYQKVSDIIAGLENGNMSLTMPKFEFESSFSLKENLAAMGMPDAFEPSAADFSSMSDSKELWLDDVKHKTFISVDENGTEAAAATAAIAVCSIPGTITIDRPFFFLIRDIETGTILFMGRVLNPVA